MINTCFISCHLSEFKLALSCFMTYAYKDNLGNTVKLTTHLESTPLIPDCPL